MLQQIERDQSSEPRDDSHVGNVLNLLRSTYVQAIFSYMFEKLSDPRGQSARIEHGTTVATIHEQTKELEAQALELGLSEDQIMDIFTEAFNEAVEAFDLVNGR